LEGESTGWDGSGRCELRGPEVHAGTGWERERSGRAWLGRLSVNSQARCRASRDWCVEILIVGLQKETGKVRVARLADRNCCCRCYAEEDNGDYVDLERGLVGLTVRPLRLTGHHALSCDCDRERRRCSPGSCAGIPDDRHCLSSRDSGRRRELERVQLRSSSSSRSTEDSYRVRVTRQTTGVNRQGVA